MRITLLDIENYLRLKKVSIRPAGRHVIKIAGMNKQGKTSLLRAISNAFGGKGEDPVMPIHKGKDRADIRIELEGDDGSYQMHKSFLKSGTSSLKVTGIDGKVTSPQKVLDRIVSMRFLDPLAFADLNDKEQREALLNAVDIGMDLKKWEKDRKAIFDSRTDVNRDVKRYKTELESNPDPGEIPKVSTAALVHVIGELNDKAAAHASAKGTYDQLKKEAEEKKEYVERLKKNLEKASKEYEEICDNGREAKGNLAKAPDVFDELSAKRRELEAASGHEEERIRKLAQKERHDNAKALLAKKTKASDEYTVDLTNMDEGKAKALSKAKMPVEGLTIGDEALFYGGVPLSQASGAEQLTVSLALAAAMSPHLQDIWAKDASLLDRDSLKLVEEFAKERNLCLWLEVVGDDVDDAIIIEDGTVKGEEEKEELNV